MLRLAWRNIWRQRRRSVTTAAAVALVVLIAVLFYSMGGALTNSFYQDVTARAGHIQVHAQGYRDQTDLAGRLLRPGDALERRVAEAAPGAEVAGVLQVPVLVAGAERSRAAVVVGADWAPELRSSATGRTLLSGAWESGADPTGIVLGRALATALRVSPGDSVSVYAPGTVGFGAGAYRVRGIVGLDDPAAEAASAYLPLAATQELAAPNAVERVELRIPGLHDLGSDAVVQATAARLRRALGSGLEVETWRQLDPTMLALVQAMNPVLYGMSLFFYILAGLLVMNTVYLSLIERVREFGLLAALGASGGKVVRMVLTESVLLCSTGAAIGAGTGLAVVAALAPGFSLPGFEGLYAAIGIAPVLYPSIGIAQVAFALGFALVTALAAASWPALLATRISPVEAMRHTA